MEDRQTLIRQSVSGYKHLDLGTIKLAFTQVCEEDIFRDVYFDANSLYYVEAGRAILKSKNSKIEVNASKAGLIGLSESMYYDLGLLDIHVVLASPGVTRTPMLGKATEDGDGNLRSLPKEGQIFYKPYLDHRKAMGESSGNSKLLPTADFLAKKLYKIVESRRPRHKYNLAIDAVFMDKIMTKIIPLSWRFALNKSMYNLNIKNPARTQ